MKHTILLSFAVSSPRWLRQGLPAAARGLDVNDLVNLERVTDPQLSPDGRYVAYQVRQTDFAANKGVNGICGCCKLDGKSAAGAAHCRGREQCQPALVRRRPQRVLHGRRRTGSTSSGASTLHRRSPSARKSQAGTDAQRV